MEIKPPTKQTKRECFDSTVQHADWRGEKMHPDFFFFFLNYAFAKEKEQKRFLFLTFCVIR